jgi:hypothetical protein
MMLVGRYATDSANIDASQLTGRCEGATHVISGIAVGAFEFFAGAAAEIGAGADVMNAGVGAKSASKHETLTRDGVTASCTLQGDFSKTPPPGCAALLRVEVAPLLGAGSTSDEQTLTEEERAKLYPKKYPKKGKAGSQPAGYESGTCPADECWTSCTRGCWRLTGADRACVDACRDKCPPPGGADCSRARGVIAGKFECVEGHGFPPNATWAAWSCMPCPAGAQSVSPQHCLCPTGKVWSGAACEAANEPGAPAPLSGKPNARLVGKWKIIGSNGVWVYQPDGSCWGVSKNSAGLSASSDVAVLTVWSRCNYYVAGETVVTDAPWEGKRSNLVGNQLGSVNDSWEQKFSVEGDMLTLTDANGSTRLVRYSASYLGTP